jgi:hypothetical protein
MKILLVTVLLSLIWTTEICAQKQDSIQIEIPSIKKGENEKGMFDEIRSLKAGKDTLFLWAKEWVYKTYKSGDAVIQMEDKDAGILICKGRTQPTIVKNVGVRVEAGTFTYDFKVSVKPGKYRILISNITYERGDLVVKEGADIIVDYPDNWPSTFKKQYQKWWDEIKGAGTTELQALILSFNKHMKESLESQW